MASSTPRHCRRTASASCLPRAPMALLVHVAGAAALAPTALCAACWVLMQGGP